MTATDFRVALVRGSGDARHDGVADYVDHLATALGTAGVAVTTVDLTSATAATSRISSCAADLVHIQFAPSAYRAAGAPDELLALLAGTPVVTTVHEYDPANRATTGLLAGSDTVVVTNEAHATAIGCPATVIPLAPNVVTTATRTRRAGGPVLAFFGYVHPVKGVRYLIEAVAALRVRRPGTRLLVIGGFTSLALPDDEATAFRAELAGHARRHGVADRVEFTGYVPPDRVSALLAGADVGVLPFTHGVTTKSGALVTLLAHGLPTVVTAADEPDPVLVDGRNVRLVRARRDSAALTEAVQDVLADAVLRERLRAAGRRLAETRSWSRVADDHVALYRKLLAGHRA